MPESPSISVLMPVYNAERYVVEAVESILGQTFTDFEFIIIDDGSTDQSLRILQRYADKDKRIRLVSRENRGLVATLNEMIDMAKGQFLARMDADDVSLPDRFERQICYIAKNKECVAVGCRALLIDPDGLPLKPFLDFLLHDDIDRAHIACIGGAICHPSVMMRKEAVIYIGGYKYEYPYAEDIDLFLRLADIGKLHNLGEMLLKYRLHYESIGHGYALEQRKSAFSAVADACRRRGVAASLEVQTVIAKQETTRMHMHQKWAWWALAAGNKNAALKHAWKAFCLNPASLASWKLLACALRGH